jgi:hypothetical protein
VRARDLALNVGRIGFATLGVVAMTYQFAFSNGESSSDGASGRRALSMGSDGAPSGLRTSTSGPVLVDRRSRAAQTVRRGKG